MCSLEQSTPSGFHCTITALYISRAAHNCCAQLPIGELSKVVSLFMCRAMLASGTLGAIVNVTSAAALRGGLSPADYSTSKAGVLALTQQAACEAAPHGIRVNSVAPAYVPTVSCIHESGGYV